MVDNKDKRIAVVFSTRDGESAKKGIIKNILETVGDGCSVQVHCLVNDGGASLTETYASILDDDSIESDVFLFIHDDIEFLKQGWGKEILRLFNDNPDYGIIGVAGSATFDSNAAWWQYKEIYGQVLHRHDGKSWLSQFSPLIEDDLQEVCVIDGLFMAVHRERISENFNADDIPGFNFYDIDFCLANYIDGSCKIGVTTNIRVAHNSIGELKQEWYDNREIVNDIFGEYYPIKVSDRNGRKRNKDKDKEDEGNKSE